MTPFPALQRRRALRTVGALALAAASAWAATGAHAQAFPDRPITLYVGFAPGGGADTVARALADEMSKTLGQRVIVDNRSGASGNIATQLALSNPADGYSLIFAAIHFATNPHLIGVKYDPQSDLQMVSQVASVPVVMLASNASGIKAPADVAALAARTGAPVAVGSGGVGTSSHLAMELLKRATGTPMNHIPYRGGAPANQDLMAGQIDMMFDLMSGSLRSIVDSKRVQAIAVMQPARLAALPGVKSAKEWGLPESTYIRSWQGIAVRGGTPAPVVERLHKAVLAAVDSPAFRARMDVLGSEATISKTPADFQKFYLAELARWGTLIKEAKIVVE